MPFSRLTERHYRFGGVFFGALALHYCGSITAA